VVSSIPCGGCPASSRILKVVAATGLIQTVAGNGGYGYGGDGGLAINAELAAKGVFVDSAGNIFIADTDNSRIREVVAGTGIIQTVAGNGVYGYSGDGGLATNAELNGPADVFVDTAGDIFIADTDNSRIREVVAATGMIQTVAGNGVNGYSGDGGLATSAELNGPADVFVDTAGNIFIADSGNNRIREVVAATGMIQTVAGNGTYGFSGDGGPATSAELATPFGLASDSSGDLLIVDSRSQRIRSVSQLLTIPWSLLPKSLNFGNQLVGTSSNAQSTTLMNTSGAALTISNIAVTGTNSGDFSQTNTCGASVAANSHCQVNVTFKPAATGMRTASLAVTDNATGSLQSVALAGTGIASAVTLSTTSLTFSGQLISTSSAAQSVTVTNSGTAPLTISSIAISGTNSGDFNLTNMCPLNPATLAVNANCQVNVTFNPAASGMRDASLTITDNATGSPQSVALAGTGKASAVTLSTTSLTFSGQLISTSSGAQSVTVTNSGTAPLIISSIAISGTNSGDFAQTNTCPASNSGLAAGANCTISVNFTPATTGNRSAVITIADNVSGSPQSVSLAGTGTDFSLAAAAGGNCPSGGNCSTSATISAGQTATYNLQVSQLSGFNGAVALTCSGTPGVSTCSVSSASVPPSGSSSYAFTVTVSNTSNVLVVPWPEFPLTPMLPALRIALPLLLALLMLLLSWKEVAKKRSLRTRLTALAVLLIGVMLSSGCAGGGGSGENHQPPTNATLTISGTSGSVKHQLCLSLTVNH
jgi:hypothetical protein